MHLGGIHLSGLEPTAPRGAKELLPGGDGRDDARKIDPGQNQDAFAKALQAELPQRPSQSSTLVPATRTQLSDEQASSALRAAWKAHFGEEPREETVAVLTAQWSHETGGGSSMYNYNFGGVKGTGPSGLTVSQRTKEGWGAHETTIRDNFRAYRTASEGAQDYISLLRRRYSGALEAAHQGDAAGFVRGLKKNGYFTGNENAYVRSVSQKTAQLLGHSPEVQAGQLPRGVALPESAKRLASSVVPSPEPAQGSLARSNTAYLPRLHDPFQAPSTLNLNAFDDALSRAALQIALDTPSAFGRDPGEEQG